MDQIEQLERQVRSLSLAVRLGVAVLIAAFTLHACFILSLSHSFREIFKDLLEGSKLPALTRFFFTFAGLMSFGTAIVATLAIIALFTFPRKIWCIPVGIFVAIACVAISQLAAFSFQLPMLQIIESLSGTATR